ncbi:MAG: HDOD domain-containing protein [Desulfobacterales bacterium]|nr:HDOD domain-containing protein [Desulfobacterales bacterium]
MNIVNVDNLQAGQVLCEDVRDVSSRLLLSKGMPIKPEHQRIFKIWGVTEVMVEGDQQMEDVPDMGVDPEIIKQVTAVMEHLYRHVDRSHSAMKELFWISIDYRSRRSVIEEKPQIKADAVGDSQKMEPGDLRKKIDLTEIKLPEIPAIIYELNEVIAAPLTSARDIARIVNKSPSIAALLLHVVNSAFYGFPSRIDSITRAVTLIGSKEITNLALGISTMRIFKSIPGGGVNMNAFIRHSLACGILARVMAAHKNIQQTEQLFISGLLHDIGRLIIFRYFPAQARKIFSQNPNPGKPFIEMEKEILGWNHARIGKYLLEKWKLPLSLENNVYHHHQPLRGKDPVSTTFVHMADIMANSLGICTSGGGEISGFDAEAWESFGLPPASFKGIIQQAMHQFTPLESIFTDTV